MELRAVRRTTAEIEEERRLRYMAMIRAKHDLHLVVPQRSFTHQQSAARRQACLCVVDALRAEWHSQSLRGGHLACRVSAGRGTHTGPKALYETA